MNTLKLASQNLSVVRAVSFAFVSETSWEEVSPVKAEIGEGETPPYPEEYSDMFPEPPDIYTVPPENAERSDEHWTAALLEGGNVLLVRTPGASNANSLTSQISSEIANAGPAVLLIADGNLYRSTGTIPVQRTFSSSGQATLNLSSTQLELCNLQVDKESQTFSRPVGVAQEVTVSFELQTEAEILTFSPDVMKVFSTHLIKDEAGGEMGAELATIWQCYTWAVNIWDWTVRLLELSANLASLMPYAWVPIIWLAIVACLIGMAYAYTQISQNLNWFIKGDCRVYLGG